MKKLLFVSLLALSRVCASAQTDQQTLNISHPESLKLIDVNGFSTAYYELRIANLSSDTLQLKSLAVMNTRDSVACYLLQDHTFEAHTRTINASNGSTLILVPHANAIVYIELGIRKNIHKVFHAITYSIVHDAHKKEVVIQTPPTICNMQMPVTLGKPLRSGIWAAVYEPSWERGHRRVIYTVKDTSRIPGRYAIDFIMLNEQGEFATGDPNLVKQWFGYGADVLAVGDGVVSSVRNDFTETATLSDHATESADRATGNYVSIKLNNQQFAFYEHLMPNSIKVNVGQKVKKGQVIGKVGFTGQTTGPHLHFHLADTDSPLGAEGLPFVLESFDVLGFYPDFDEFGKKLWQPIEGQQPVRLFQERPAPNYVIKFH